MKTVSIYNETLMPPPKIRGLDFSLREREEARSNNRMLLLTLLTHMGCNFKCPYCFTTESISHKKRPMTLDEYEKVFLTAKNLGARSIWWVGLGEPLLYQNLWGFLQLITSLGLVPLIFTNGSLLTEEIANTLYDLGASIYIKLNSFNPQIQNELVGNIKGASMRMMEGLKHLMNAGFNETSPHRMAIQSVITKRNLGDIPELFRWARHNNIVPFFEIIVYTGFPVSKQLREIDLTVEEMKVIFEKLLEIDQKEFGHVWIPSPPYVCEQCDKYYYALTIDPYGNVLSCAASRAPVGNIRQTSLKELWDHPFLRKIRRMDEFIEGKCKTCDISCTGCRAEVFSKTGNVFGEFERCWR